ncbi:MAG: hypothetical protein MZV63_60665 [Marinilabiliales bacterium]|nr:hypothetical protein [Marinilabiliales bacterium]
MTKFKAEFLNHYYKSHGIPLRTLLIGWLTKAFNKVGGDCQGTADKFHYRHLRIFRKSCRFNSARGNLPSLSATTPFTMVQKAEKGKFHPPIEWEKSSFSPMNLPISMRVDIGISVCSCFSKNLAMMSKYRRSAESGRTFLSKGMPKNAGKSATGNDFMLHYHTPVSEEMPLVGIEPLAILSFRDEYPEIVDESSLGKVH